MLELRDVPASVYAVLSVYLALGNTPHEGPLLATRCGLSMTVLATMAVLWPATRVLAGPCKEPAVAVTYTSLSLLFLQRVTLCLSDQADELSLWPVVGIMVVVQLGGLMLGHELLHQSALSSRFWPVLVLLQNGYAVYIWEHRFHHKHAGSVLDLASTPRGMSIYSYLLARYPTHIRSSLRHFPAAFFATTLAFAAYVAAVAAAFSQATAGFLLAMTLAHWFFVDSFTYTSHYGVVGLPSGDISWDCHMRSILMPFFYGIEHHTDHHYGPSHLAGALAGRGRLKYPVCLEVALLKAFVPPLWFGMTDPILDAANVQAKQAATKAS
jgi:hypothetical protein